MAALMGRYVEHIPATSSATVTTYFITRGITKYSGAFWYRRAVKMMYVNNHGAIALCLTIIQGQHLLTLY